MTKNDTVRKMTTDYAMLLSELIKNVTITHQYKNFDMLYTDLPIDKSKSLKTKLYQILRFRDFKCDFLFFKKYLINGFQLEASHGSSFFI